MKSKRYLLLPLLVAPIMSGCGGKKADVTLVVYNWADYIYEGTDDDGNIIDEEGGTLERFEKFYEEKTGKTVKVDYRTFSTPEEMYQQIKLGSVSPDLICPSDYMIQKMANEGLLEKFSYDVSKDKYGESLKNWEDYGSPFIKNRFNESKLSDGITPFSQYSVPYFWGTMGFTYDPELIDTEVVSSWEVLWSKDAKLSKKLSLKDSMRDSYVAAIFHVYKDEIATLTRDHFDDDNFNAELTKIFNRCDDATINAVQKALIEAKQTTVKSFEVDDGKDEIVKGNLYANLAWSGDSVYSMDSAEESDKFLNYALPVEGSNVWFDGWCMPKGANVELAEEFVNFMCDPAIAALNMDYVGYTSPIVGEDIWELVNDWYAAGDNEAEVYEVDLGFYFGESIEGEAKIKIPESERGRQFDAQYPTQEVLKKCCIMNDFGEQTSKVEKMWVAVKAA